MNYKAVISNVNLETSSFIRMVLRVFSQLSKKTDVIKPSDGKKASIDDIKVMSIAAASLYCNNCSCKTIFNKYGINFTSFAQCFNLDITIFDKKNVEEDNEVIYDKYFSSLIDDIICDKALSKPFLEVLSPEIMVLNSISSNSNIFDLFFEYCEKNNSGMVSNPTQAVKEIKESYEKKVPKTQDKPNYFNNSNSDNNGKNSENDFDRDSSRPSGFGNSFMEMFGPKNNYENESALKKYGILLNDREFLTNPAVERDVEIDNTIDALCTFRKNAMLTGAPGVGKTAIVEGIAYRIKNGTIESDRLKNAKIYKIDVQDLVSGTQYRGDFEQKVGRILKEASSDKNIILFFDEIHNALGSGRAIGAPLDLANMLKSYLDRDGVKVIASTTDEEYDEFIKKDEAFKRRFERIKILEPEDKAVVIILDNLIPELEFYNHTVFGYSDKTKKAALEFIVKTTNKACRPWDDKSYNPDLAISILCKSFAIAEREKSEKVTSEHIKKAILACDRLYLGSRTDSANRIDTVLELKKTEKSKVIPFTKK